MTMVGFSLIVDIYFSMELFFVMMGLKFEYLVRFGSNFDNDRLIPALRVFIYNSFF